MLTARTVGLFALPLVVSAMALAGCSDEHTVGERHGSGEPTAESSGPWAMTGQPRPPGRDEATVLTVKIENTEGGQVALDDADLVTELPVEGGLTRLAAFYESKTPEQVGPVRSARNSDIGLVKPANSVLVASGGAQSTLNDLNAAGLTLVTEDSPGMTRDRNISGDNNLFANLKEIRRNHPDQQPSQPYLSFGEFQGTGGVAAKTVQITFSGVSNEGWTYDKTTKKWNRQALGAYSADTLLVFQVTETDAGYKDAAGSSVPIVQSTGQGKGWLVTGGQVFDVNWSKASDDAPWHVSTSTGQELQVPPGNTWISLIPVSTGNFSHN